MTMSKFRAGFPLPPRPPTLVESPVTVNRLHVAARCGPPGEATFRRQSGKLKVEVRWQQDDRDAIRRFHVRHGVLGSSQQWSEVGLTFHIIFSFTRNHVKLKFELSVIWVRFYFAFLFRFFFAFELAKHSLSVLGYKNRNTSVKVKVLHQLFYSSSTRHFKLLFVLKVP